MQAPATSSSVLPGRRDRPSVLCSDAEKPQACAVSEISEGEALSDYASYAVEPSRVPMRRSAIRPRSLATPARADALDDAIASFATAYAIRQAPTTPLW